MNPAGPSRHTADCYQEEAMPAGFTEEGLKALDAALERHVERGEVPGLVAFA